MVGARPPSLGSVPVGLPATTRPYGAASDAAFSPRLRVTPRADGPARCRPYWQTPSVPHWSVCPLAAVPL